MGAHPSAPGSRSRRLRQPYTARWKARPSCGTRSTTRCPLRSHLRVIDATKKPSTRPDALPITRLDTASASATSVFPLRPRGGAARPHLEIPAGKTGRAGRPDGRGQDHRPPTSCCLPRPRERLDRVRRRRRTQAGAQVAARAMRVVTQEPFLFDTSIIENNPLWPPRGESTREVVAAARAGENAHDFVEKLPQATRPAWASSAVSFGGPAPAHHRRARDPARPADS